MSFQPLLTTRLKLRLLEISDAAAVSMYRSDPAVARFQGWSAPFSTEQALRLIEEMQARDLGDEGWTQIGVADLETNLLLGDIGFKRFEPRHAELGFTLAAPHQGKGIMREALEMLLNFAFSRLDLHRVVANTDARNTASQGLLTRLGFRLEGVSVESWWEAEVWYDEHHYALLRREWKAPDGTAYTEDVHAKPKPFSFFGARDERR
jgi:RimJ/RimL family protein N-acetyltransferase